MAETGTILLVEDNTELNALNTRALKSEGYRVVSALSLAQARVFLDREAPDVILLDVMLPDGDGLEFCAEIRGKTDAHILFLTSKAETNDRIRGLNAGGDDYIVKPYRLQEMLSRVHAAMRRRRMRGQAEGDMVIVRGPITVDAMSGQAFMNGKNLLLTPKEFALLALLVKDTKRMLSKAALYESVWGQPLKGDGAALWKHMSNLKKKIEVGGSVTLVTYRGDGYVLEILE